MSVVGRYPSHAVVAAACLGVVSALVVRLAAGPVAVVGAALAAACVRFHHAETDAWRSQRLRSSEPGGEASDSRRSTAPCCGSISARSLRPTSSSPARLRVTRSLRFRCPPRRFDRGALREPVLLELPLGARRRRAVLELARGAPPRAPPTASTSGTGSATRRSGRPPGGPGESSAAGAVSRASADRLRERPRRLARARAAGERRAWSRGSSSARTRGSRRARGTPSAPPASTTSWPSPARTSASSSGRSCWRPLGLPRWLGRPRARRRSRLRLAVGWQPSVVRAGVAGALASLAWLAARPRDRWYFLLAGAAVLLAWNPTTCSSRGSSCRSPLSPRSSSPSRASSGSRAIRSRLARRPRSPSPARAASQRRRSSGSSSARCRLLGAATCSPAGAAPLLGLGLAAAALDPLVPRPPSSRWCKRLARRVPRRVRATRRRLPGARSRRCRRCCASARRRRLFAAARLRCARRRLLRGRAGRSPASGSGTVRRRHAPPPPAGLRITFLDVGQGDASSSRRRGACSSTRGRPRRTAEQLRRRPSAGSPRSCSPTRSATTSAAPPTSSAARRRDRPRPAASVDEPGRERRWRWRVGAGPGRAARAGNASASDGCGSGCCGPTDAGTRGGPERAASSCSPTARPTCSSRRTPSRT